MAIGSETKEIENCVWFDLNVRCERDHMKKWDEQPMIRSIQYQIEITF